MQDEEEASLTILRHQDVDNAKRALLQAYRATEDAVLAEQLRDEICEQPDLADLCDLDALLEDYAGTPGAIFEMTAPDEATLRSITSASDTPESGRAKVLLIVGRDRPPQIPLPRRCRPAGARTLDLRAGRGRVLR